jgi:hypothetical protein
MAHEPAEEAEDIHWRPFLERYSKELLKSKDPRIELPEDARSSGWMGFAPAPETAIEAAEKRLERSLPPSLKSFYRVTNGWRATGFFIWDVLPVEKIGWLRDRDPDLYRIACEAEDDPGPFKRDPGDERLRYYRDEQGTRVKRSLIITSVGDAARWLLDPGAEVHGGEWPGGRWAGWNPAMQWTAKSFADLMRQEFESFLALRDQK